MAPFVEGEKILGDGEEYLLKAKAKGKAPVVQALHIQPQGDRLIVRVTEGDGINAVVADFELDPKEGIKVGEREVKWKEEE